MNQNGINQTDHYEECFRMLDDYQYSNFSKYVKDSTLSHSNHLYFLDKIKSIDSIRNQKDQTLLICLCKIGKVPMLDQFCVEFQQQLNPNFQDADGATALHYAVNSQRIDTIQRLKSYFGLNLNLNIKDNLGNKPQDYTQDQKVKEELFLMNE